MTPAEHITAAEAALKDAGDVEYDDSPESLTMLLLLGIGHALIALAVESGVPHQTTTTPGS